jgi:DNA-binding GntR family transcriptional regulator
MRHRGPVPLYHQVQQHVRARIAAGDYAVGAALPTEWALMKEFGVSRHTVRTALQELVAEGQIERFPGRGSFVVEHARRASQWAIGAVEDLIDMSFAHSYAVLSARLVKAAAYPRVAELFGHLRTIFHVRAVRASAEGPYAYSNVWFPPEIGEKLPRRLFSQRPLILLVEEYCGLPPYRTRQAALAAPADRDAARHLKVAFGDPMLVLERTYFTADDRPIEHTRIQYRPDRYQQIVNFQRRQAPPYLASAQAESRSPRGEAHVPAR